jgi:hypothetical protein
MVTSTAGKPSVGTAARFAYAAGFTGILANLFLIALYVALGLQAGGPEAQTPSLGPAGELSGSASDLVGSLSVAFMIPVALVLGGRLPRRRAARLTQAAGLTAMALLTVGGPLLVLGVLAVRGRDADRDGGVDRPLSLAVAGQPMVAFVGRPLGPGGTTRRGLGGGAVGRVRGRWAGLLLPWMSWPQLVVFGVGVLIGLPAYLGIPVWFVFLGRHLAAS